jgi:hypothetical protein
MLCQLAVQAAASAAGVTACAACDVVHVHVAQVTQAGMLLVMFSTMFDGF